MHVKSEARHHVVQGRCGSKEPITFQQVGNCFPGRPEPRSFLKKTKHTSLVSPHCEKPPPAPLPDPPPTCIACSEKSQADWAQSRFTMSKL